MFKCQACLAFSARSRGTGKIEGLEPVEAAVEIEGLEAEAAVPFEDETLSMFVP